MTPVRAIGGQTTAAAALASTPAELGALMANAPPANRAAVAALSPRSEGDYSIAQKDEELALLRKQVAQKDSEIEALSPRSDADSSAGADELHAILPLTGQRVSSAALGAPLPALLPALGLGLLRCDRSSKAAVLLVLLLLLDVGVAELALPRARRTARRAAK